MMYNNFKQIFSKNLKDILRSPHYINKDTYECINKTFVLSDINKNKCDKANYEYAEIFFEWILSGDTVLCDKIKKINPFAEKFLDSTNLPSSFSSTYGWKIKSQLNVVIEELKKEDSRRSYININIPEDKKILEVNTSHEFPCTIGLHFMIRENKLIMISNMRSNNAWSVLPYDVFNFTSLQKYICNKINKNPGNYIHQANSMHIFKKDLKSIKNYLHDLANN